MSIAVMSAAKTACEESAWSLTNLSLQKILYLAHMKFMGENDGQPLIREKFEAWKYGPVVSILYQTVKSFGDNKIPDIFFSIRNLDRTEHKYIQSAVERYGNLRPGILVDLTHRANGAWSKHFKPRIDHIIIPNSSILQEYKDLGV